MSETAKAENNTVLLVEDSKTNRLVFTHLLHKLGFDVLECEDGSIAWEILNNPEKSKNIVCVVSDIMMPKLDGISLLKKVRETEHIKDIKFLLVTAVMEKQQVLTARSLGISGYILKPVTFKRVHDIFVEIFPDRNFPPVGND